jgi:biopolymer transport protein ExbD
MAMSIPGESTEHEVMLDINTTPLIDVMLVLLVMLIITIPVQLHAIKMELPTGRPPANAAPPEIIRIDIDAQSAVFWQGIAVTPTQLAHNMAEIATVPTPPEIHVRPSKDAAYATFAAVLAESRRKNLNRLAVIGSEQFAP